MALYDTFEYAFCYNDEKVKHAATNSQNAENQPERRPAGQIVGQSNAAVDVCNSDEESTESTRFLLGEAIVMETYRNTEDDSVCLYGGTDRSFVQETHVTETLDADAWR